MNDFRKLLRASQEPQYFIENYFIIQHPIDGIRLPKLNQEQQRVLSVYQPSYLNRKYISYGMNRQTGKSTLIAGLALHEATFKDNQSILVISFNPNMGDALRQIIQYGWENLPEVLKLKMVRNNRSIIEFDNGSIIRFIDPSRDSCFFRGNTIDSFFIQDHELFTKEYWEELLTCVIPLLYSTSKILDLYSNPDLIATNNLTDLKIWS